MNGEYERYLIRLLAPLGLYDLNGAQNRSELAALGAALDGVSALLDTVERESLLNTAEDEGLSRREALFARKPASSTTQERRDAIAALMRIGEDSLTPEAAALPLAVTAAWIAVGAVAFRLLYRRLAQDN